MRNPICLAKTIYRSIKGTFIDGCDFEVHDVVKNCTVTILKCKECGKISVVWERQ
jgi:hypothetical protein